MRIVEARATYHTEDGQPYMTLDLLKWDRRAFLYKLWWILKCWRRLDFVLTVEKKAAVGRGES